MFNMNMLLTRAYPALDIDWVLIGQDPRDSPQPPPRPESPESFPLCPETQKQFTKQFTEFYRKHFFVHLMENFIIKARLVVLERDNKSRLFLFMILHVYLFFLDCTPHHMRISHTVKI